MPKTRVVIGLDFDNTLVSYDDVMLQTALELNFLSGNPAVHTKQQIRDGIRTTPDGELKWQELQAEVYGKRMQKARLMEGVARFLNACKDNNVSIFIVSHKTRYAAQDKEKINLQDTALNWMRQQHFFDKGGLGLSEDRVYFEHTRNDKVLRIKTLGCTHFIDDLPEVFLEKAFPDNTVQVLFSSGPTNCEGTLDGIKYFGHWNDIYDYFFVKP